MRLVLPLIILSAVLTACTAPLEVTNGYDAQTAPDLRALIEVTK